MEQQVTKKNYMLVAGFVLSAVLVCLISISCKSKILFDEAFTINLVRHSFGEIVELTALDVHPPLYYFVVKLFTMIFGDNPVAYYAPSILCFMLLLVAAWFFFKKYFSEKIAIFVIAVLCAAPNMLKYALQIRMYSMAMLLVTISFFLVYSMTRYAIGENIYKWNKYWVILAIINVLAAYTHYFAGLAAVVVSFVLLGYLLYAGKERKRTFLNWCIYCGIMFVLYLPWLFVLLKQLKTVHADYWIKVVTEKELHNYPEMLFEMPTSEMRLILIALYVTGLCVFLFHWKKEHQDIWLAGCYVVVGMWFIIGMGYSVLCTPIMNERYMVPLLPLLWFPICVTFGRRTCKYAQAAILFAFVICFTQNYEKQYDRYSTDEQNEMVTHIEFAMTEKDVMVHSFIQNMAIGAAYFPEMEHYIPEGRDSSEVFHYWPELTDCHMLTNLQDLSTVEGNIWCQGIEFIDKFKEMGWTVEEIPMSDGELYRIYR